ncbi:MAG: methylated-DNA--[protein]-cysteine S-methyltransferase [Proteobacteria bacterium]|nr:methylated-DNA--[protein]-cysteine S-methyltransferase [Pseudomonadota bacterium]
MPLLSLHSPIGDLSVAEEDGRIVSLDWGWGSEQSRTSLLREAARQINAYFDGELQEFSLPLAPPGTPFQQSLWAALGDIPYGETLTYGTLAKRVKTSPRAAGMACGANPLPLIIPCHRVVGAAGQLGGYSGRGGTDTKTALLRLEGAPGFGVELFPV